MNGRPLRFTDVGGDALLFSDEAGGFFRSDEAQTKPQTRRNFYAGELARRWQKIELFPLVNWRAMPVEDEKYVYAIAL